MGCKDKVVFVLPGKWKTGHGYDDKVILDMHYEYKVIFNLLAAGGEVKQNVVIDKLVVAFWTATERESRAWAIKTKQFLTWLVRTK